MQTNRFKKIALSATIGVAGISISAQAARDIFLAPTGSDSAAGTLASPYASFTKAISVAAAGDTIYARGGTYNLNAQLTITKAGTAALPFKLFAYQNESPVLNFATEPAGKRGVQIDTDYWHIKGLTIQNAADNGVFISGSNNTLERLLVHHNQDSGVQIAAGGTRRPSNNLILNVDSYLNYDPANHGENADGFAVKFRGVGPGNVIRGSRAWGNSDDGIDFWGCESGVVVENTWCYANGFNIFSDTAWAGDGNGIKLGHDSGTHTIRNNAFWGNRLNGVDVNGNALNDVDPTIPITHGVSVVNNTAYNNGAGGLGYNFNFDESFAHILKNNLSFAGGSGGVNSANVFSGVVSDHNTWNAIPVDANDFISLGDALARGARNSDGSLPITGFLRLKRDSNLLNAGTNVGLSFTGTNPDLGAFEDNMPLRGDANLDHTVEFADLLIVAQQYGSTGATWTGGDFNFDGVVGFDDLLALAQNYGVTQFQSGTTLDDSVHAAFLNDLQSVGLLIPEPGSAACLALVAFIRRGRR